MGHMLRYLVAAVAALQPSSAFYNGIVESDAAMGFPCIVGGISPFPNGCERVFDASDLQHSWNERCNGHSVELPLLMSDPTKSNGTIAGVGPDPLVMIRRGVCNAGQSLVIDPLGVTRGLLVDWCQPRTSFDSVKG